MIRLFRLKLAAWLAGAAVLSGMAGGAAAAPRVGLLECNVAPGVGLVVVSSRTLACVLTPRHGPREYYTGTINRFGLDLGFTSGGRFAWAVFTAGSALPPYALAGEFVGASGSAAFGGGVSANVLIGGTNRSISLQPLSLGVETGLNLSAGVGGLSLQPAAPPRRL